MRLFFLRATTNSSGDKAQRLFRTLVALPFMFLSMPVVALSAAAMPLEVAELTRAPALDPQASPSAWPVPSALTLGWDVAESRPALDSTQVRVAADGHFLYVRFDAEQREPVVATQHGDDTITGGSQGSNGSLSWSDDDAVWVDLWPTGPAGFAYQFEANPIGAHNESSSENAAFAPHWVSRGVVRAGGYTVTMAIPIAVVHGARSGTWRAQFVRFVRATGAENVWSYAPGQTNPDDAARAGAIGLVLAGKAPLPAPRAAVYALGALTSRDAGGSTSRVGADISIPVTPTAAFFTALHPDYSNVELDQQTIAPSVYQRQYTEVRPFFTQAASFYNNFNCDACSGGHTTLYTPAIPTFAQGYAFEGKQGPAAFAAFDAIGNDRRDSAGVFDFTSDDTRWRASIQHVTADLRNVVDASNEAGVQWSDLKYLSAYANFSNETGTTVPSPGSATAFDIGAGYGSPHFAFYGAERRVGQSLDPIDGYVAHPGIAGYAVYGARIWTFAPSSAFASMGISGFLDRYQGPSGGQAQSDNQVLIDVLTKSAWDLQLFSGSDYWRFADTLSPISQNGGFSLTYHSGLQTNDSANFPAHGTSATPTQIEYITGAYGSGRLDTWFRTSTLRAGEKGTVTLTLDDTSQSLRSGTGNVQWFDGVAYTYQLNRESSFAIGLRSVMGDPPQPNGGGNCVGRCSNVSIAYHLALRDDEFYLAYGNPNTLTTVPQAILKAIFYVGGQKGT